MFSGWHWQGGAGLDRLQGLHLRRKILGHLQILASVVVFCCNPCSAALQSPLRSMQTCRGAFVFHDTINRGAQHSVGSVVFPLTLFSSSQAGLSSLWEAVRLGTQGLLGAQTHQAFPSLQSKWVVICLLPPQLYLKHWMKPASMGQFRRFLPVAPLVTNKSAYSLCSHYWVQRSVPPRLFGTSQVDPVKSKVFFPSLQITVTAARFPLLTEQQLYASRDERLQPAATRSLPDPFALGSLARFFFSYGSCTGFLWLGWAPLQGVR